MLSKAKKKGFILGLVLSACAVYLATALLIRPFSSCANSLNDSAPSDYRHTASLEGNHSEYRRPIVDRGGTILAYTRKVKSIGIRPHALPSPEKWAGSIASILNIDTEHLIDQVMAEKNFIWLKKDVSEQEILKLNETGLRGIDISHDYIREYPYGTLAAHVLGFVDDDNSGLAGIEFFYDGFLKGTTDFPHAKELILTLEKNIQYQAEDLLRNQAKILRAKRGCLIIMDTQNGDLLALANVPSWEPENFWQYDNLTITNHALTAFVDPLVLWPLLRKISSLNEGVQIERKKWRWNEMTEDAILWSPWSPEQLINVPARDSYAKSLWVLGMGQATGIDLPGEETGTLPPFSALGDDVFIGRTALATPIQILRAFTALINDGYLVKPHICAFEQGKNLDTRSQDSIAYSGKTRICDRFPPSSLTAVKKDLSTGGGLAVASATWTNIPVTASTGNRGKKVAQIVALGFWPAKNPKISYILVLDDASVDPRKRPGTLGRTIQLAKKASLIPLISAKLPEFKEKLAALDMVDTP